MSGREFTFEQMATLETTRRIVIEFSAEAGWSAKVYGPVEFIEDQSARPVLSQHYYQSFDALIEALGKDREIH